MIENYLHLFSNLRTDKACNRYSAQTLHRAPHKPFLLLSVMDLIAHGAIAENFMEPSYELVDTFNLYWKQIMPPGSFYTDNLTSHVIPIFQMENLHYHTPFIWGDVRAEIALIGRVVLKPDSNNPDFEPIQLSESQSQDT